MDTDEMYSCLIGFGIATEQEISLVTSINGDNTDTYESILYVRTGYNSFDQLD